MAKRGKTKTQKTQKNPKGKKTAIQKKGAPKAKKTPKTAKAKLSKKKIKEKSAVLLEERTEAPSPLKDLIGAKTLEKILKITENNKSIPYEKLSKLLGLEDQPDELLSIIDRLEQEGVKVDEPNEGGDPETITAAAIEDPLQIYLRDIGRVPLLASDEEHRLAKVLRDANEKLARIERELGMEIKEFKNLMKSRSSERTDRLKEISPTQRRIYSAIIKEADRDISESQRLLIESNLRLVVSIAKRYVNRGLPLLDLINEGNLGLIRAVEKFDHRKGYKFSTYATWWIRQSIRRALADQGRTIRVPVHMSEMINRWIKVTRYLSQKLGREPSVAETAEEMATSETKVLEIIKIAQEPNSLEDPIGPSTGSVFADIIADEESISPVRSVMAVMFSDYTQKMLETLKEKERLILQLRFGLGGQRAHTLEEVGNILGITRERVRQVEARTLEKLRHMRLTQELLSLVDEH